MNEEATRAALLAERAEVLGAISDLDGSFDDIVAAARDSNLDDEHDPEGTTIAAERSLVSSLSRSAQERLAAIDAALDRLSDGTYGVCLRCGNPIASGRLEARPSTPVCVDCARGGRAP